MQCMSYFVKCNFEGDEKFVVFVNSAFLEKVTNLLSRLDEVFFTTLKINVGLASEIIDTLSRTFKINVSRENEAEKHEFQIQHPLERHQDL